MKKLFVFFCCISFVFCEINVLFTPNKKTYDEFINLLQSAKKSIYISTFSISSDFLNFLKNKNIDLKIICEYGNLPDFKIKKIESKNLFHAKFIIVDENIVIITSANLTKSNFYKNHNNLVIINDKNIAKYFLKKFDSYWNNYRYTETFKNRNIEIWFSPENDCEDLILRELKNSKSSINFATYTFSNKKIADYLVEKRKEKIKILGILESYNIYHSVFPYLTSFGCEVRKSCMAGLLHDKFFIIDGKKVITGSFNPTKQAKENFELVCLIENKKIAEIFYNEWEKLYLFKSIKN
ncbi:MAG: phospholipase D-like domain-containing protein [Candidatus Omnitrophica bacterium]|nr:phospholipase D-like domain-containing protein [Candidatus Omnitrophota bacterium]